ncbi:lim and transglutaminase domain protein ltd-1-like [Mercenaria mercenaria]|uniref:lim and transglutaminase domain protein ltd-1-like n=1 Tax=Mercenaria mercenaria TaxID=6596 RepID=UPI00234FABF3|nr:lim and transglutaminase domain protein ltd-1-like [Mercenaria mercenaria]
MFLFFRKAGLQCVIIKGYVKAAGYEPGNKNVPEASWNAVHVECGWQLVHPFWVCRALYGHNLDGWVKVEVDGTTMSKKESASAGVVRNTFQERYFMPDPENFIYECYASDPQWQLVKPSSTVHSKEHFLEMPYLLPPFFGVNFELTSEQKCILYSEEGFCKVELKGKPANAHMIMLNYELFLKDTENDSKNGFQKEKNMSRMVFNSRGAEMFVFDIRFPARGTYKLVIYGGPYKSPALRLCEFRLICDKEMTDRNLLPLECSRIGWGPGPVSVEAGLLIPSKLSGLIPVNPNEKKTSIKFQLLREMKLTYRAHIYGEVGGQRITFDDNIEIEVTQLQQLHISAAIPTEGEFGLSIHRVTTGNQQERNICNYLLSTLAYKTVKVRYFIQSKSLDIGERECKPLTDFFRFDSSVCTL